MPKMPDSSLCLSDVEPALCRLHGLLTQLCDGLPATMHGVRGLLLATIAL